MPDASGLADRRRYQIWARETCRYGDTDRQGHVNNTVFATFCETGRARFLHAEDGLRPAGTEFVIVRLVLDFRAELRWRDEVDIGTAVLRIGGKSFTLGQGLFRGEQCVAVAESTLVLMNEATRRAISLPDALRARLQALDWDVPDC